MTLTFKIQIRGIKKPPVWRRLEIPGSYTFEEFHLAIQESFGWWNYQLYQFEKSPFGNDWVVKKPDEDDAELDNDALDSEKTRVFDFLMKTHLTKFAYVYDFGDSWVQRCTRQNWWVSTSTLSHFSGCRAHVYSRYAEESSGERYGEKLREVRSKCGFGRSFRGERTDAKFIQ